MAATRPSERFRERMKTLRTRQGLSQRTLAEAMTENGQPMSQPAVSWVESGERKVSLDEAVVIARVLHVPLDALIYDSWEDYVLTRPVPERSTA